MHHQDFSGDPPGTGGRKPAYHHRKGGGGTSASPPAGGSGADACDDHPTPAGSSSPALHHQPQSQVPGAQMKKKSGFQITSVTSAKTNVSGNNSLADDTESYDDMDESHTEDLSSSDMLDVSVSRAADAGVPARSSSDETLNSLHGVDASGIVSPNEPLHPHSIAQGSHQHTAMVNGTMPHHYYHQHSQTHLHHPDGLGGVEPFLPTIPVASVVGSSPAVVSKAMPNQSQRAAKMENTKPAGGTNQLLAPIVGRTANEPHLQSSGNLASVSTVTAAAVPPSGPTGFDNTSMSGQVASVGGGTGQPAAAPSTQTQHSHTQTATGSRFRVVKLDTNSEPFRKGRWTCTEYYEKEIPHPTTVEAPKGAEVAAETETANVHPPHTLQPYQQPTQDFTSPQAIHSPPQGLAQTTPLTFLSSQEAHMQKPVTPLPTATPQAGISQPPPVVAQQLPYGVDPQQAQPQGGYPAPQLHSGVMAPGNARQPDFIQPTAPFQTQVQLPLPHVPGITAQQQVQQLPHQGQGAPPALAAFGGRPQTLPAQPRSQAHTHGTYMPLTAVLQPLLTTGATFAQVPKTSHLEDAQRLLLQHQSLLGLPRLGPAGFEGAAEATSAAGALAHMGMSAEASVFMAAAAAGLRTQHEGEEDSSSGASVVAIDNKIEQAMDLVKSHLMYAVREEVEVLKEQIKELVERNTQLEQENNLLKNLASPEQMAQFQAQVQPGGSPPGAGQAPAGALAATQVLPSTQNSGPSA